jgi:3-deoxy-D-manno-octulosonic-acid transferase
MDGELRLWCHVGTKVDVRALIATLDLLIAENDALQVSLTGSRGVALPEDLPPEIETLTRPADILRPMGKFIAETRPNVAAFAGDGIPTAAIIECNERGVPTIWINATTSAQNRFRDKLSGLRASPRYRMLDRILASTEADAAELLRRGVSDARLEVTGPLERPPDLPPFDESEWEHILEIVSTRPVWLAMGVPPEELGDVLDAYRFAGRIAHRLLLVVVPDVPENSDRLVAQLSAAGLSSARRSMGEDPSEETRVLVADSEGEDGLWYRLAPVTYLGGTLSDARNRHPFQAARLGSALIIGGQAGRNRGAVGRLVAAKACRPIREGAELARAVTDLLAPDRTALLAGRAWEVVSMGADAEDRVATAIRTLLSGPQS